MGTIHFIKKGAVSKKTQANKRIKRKRYVFRASVILNICVLLYFSIKHCLG